ncbi:hypothetical protein JRI60_10895 [Archangium violaceum]|uniref:DUF6683 family protein n=1 Tax=Archangium violaceum TaxID=83451 RepID=UPI001950D30D|nr:DUF6683 family protein [Archangium violaceum]QRN99485.1 hypothetical protein JRI60_10895 [Archangium violaceum]
MNDFSRTVFAIAVGCILLGSAGEAGAQPTSPYRQYSGSMFVNGNLKLFFRKQWWAHDLREQGRNTAGGRQALVGTEEASGILQVKLPLAVSSFRSVGGPIVPRRLAAGLQDIDEEHRQSLETSFSSLLKGYEQHLDRNDEQRLKNNLAGAFSFLFASAYLALKNQELSDEQRESMLEQLNDGIAMALKERRLSDRDKQEMYESVVLAGTIVRGLYAEGRDKGRPEQLKLARELGKDLLEQMLGLTLDKVRVDGDSVRLD